MNSTKATSVKYSVRPFFGFILRQNWQHLALYTILALLVMFVPCLLSFAEGIPDFHGFDTGEDYIRNMMWDLNKIAVVLSAGIGILAGMSAVGYVNSKSHVGCWHSFPVSRTKMYLIETGTRAIYYAIAILIGFVSAHILAGVFFGFGISGMAGILFTGLLQAASCFLIVYSVTLLAGGLCGTAPMRFIMLCIISFLPVALYALTVYLFSDGMSVYNANLYESYYFDTSYMQVICLPYRAVLFTGLEETYPALMCLWLLPEAALYYIGGLLLHKYRKSEASGTTIIWKPVFAAVKYVILFTCGLLGMFMIGSNYVTGNGGVMRAILGTFIGLIVAFMVMNAILYKSSRAMFRGIRPFIACAAVTLAFVFLIPLNITGLVGKDYSPSMVKRLEVGSFGLEFTDREDIEALMHLMQDEERVQLPSQTSYLVSEGNEEYLEKWFESASNPANWEDEYLKERGLEPSQNYITWSDSIRVIEYPKFGIPFAKMIQIDRNSEFWRTIRLSEEYYETYDISGLDPENVFEIEISIGEESLYMYHADRFNGPIAIEYDTMGNATEEYFTATLGENEISVHYMEESWNAPASAVLTSCVLPEGYPDQPIVGQVRVGYLTEDNEHRSQYYPIYADNCDLINETNRMAAQARKNYGIEGKDSVTVNTPEDVIAMLIPDDTRSVLVNYETSEAKVLEADELRALLLDAVCVNRDRRYESRSNTRASTVPYGIYISRGQESSHIEIRFRDGAATEEELAGVFASLD